MTNKPIYEEIVLDSLEKINAFFLPSDKLNSLLETHIFRGEASSDFKLIPSLLREYNSERIFDLTRYGIPRINNQYLSEYYVRQAEVFLLQRFFKLSDKKGLITPEHKIFRKNLVSPFPLSHSDRNYFNSCSLWLSDDLLEIASLAQHFGVPTRLIDWSQNLYSSLYFATSGAIKNFAVRGEKPEYISFYALNSFHIDNLKDTTTPIPIRLIKPQGHINSNLNFQQGVLSCWNYPFEQGFIPTFENDIPVVLDASPANKSSLDDLLIKLENENHNTHNESILKKHLIPFEFVPQIYDHIINMGFGADSLFTGHDAIYKRMEDDMYYQHFCNSYQ